MVQSWWFVVVCKGLWWFSIVVLWWFVVVFRGGFVVVHGSFSPKISRKKVM